MVVLSNLPGFNPRNLSPMWCEAVHICLCFLLLFIFEGVQNKLPQHVPSWHVDYVEMKSIKA